MFLDAVSKMAKKIGVIIAIIFAIAIIYLAMPLALNGMDVTEGLGEELCSLHPSCAETAEGLRYICYCPPQG